MAPRNRPHSSLGIANSYADLAFAARYASAIDAAPYSATEAVEDEWKWLGTVQFFRRSLTDVASSLTDEGFLIDRLIEPIPTDAFREVKPEAYERLLIHPEFLIIRAISRAV